ncbi:MAG: hypothetical protein LKE64_05695 [Solobacterium sp.]|jgi:hypothetical protein|nr:hypothetical protein [Solobacterium sp.]MCH4050175.1 hypothetical protein [Solobacterium sp.]MCH4073966.1 hypothetical protein [Solobacterium sp.]
MMLKDYPIYFDETELFTPESWEESYSVIESTNQTEAGTDQVIVTRYDKLSVSASFQCSSRWAAKFAEFRDKDSIQVKLYDLKSQDYKTRTMRMRNFKTGPEKNSEKTRGTNGLYTVSFDLEEF